MSYSIPKQIFESFSLAVIAFSLVLIIYAFPEIFNIQNVAVERLFTTRTLNLTQTDISGEAGESGGTEKTSPIEKNDLPDTRMTLHQAASDPQLCVNYDSREREISISCKNANLTMIQKVISNPSALTKENDTVWLLNSNLTIEPDAYLSIDSNDTKWLKINSTASEDAYHIDVLGSLKIDGVKISSWNTTANNYTFTNGTTHRASIAILPDSTGNIEILNSELAYLGYDRSPRQGLYFSGGDGSIVRNNTIHHMWFGFYSKGTGNVTIEDNHVYDSLKYGIDPHTGTHDMVIRNNKVNGNGHIGIICSLDCKNITIDGNVVFNNTNSGIMLSKNVQNSIVRNNRILNESTGISISQSANNDIYNNTITSIDFGIQAKLNSSRNLIQNNSVTDAARYGILMVNAPKENLVMHNRIINPSQNGICVTAKGSGNIISANVIENSQRHGICVNNQVSDNQIRSNLILGALGYGIYVTNSNLQNNTFMNNAIQNTKSGITLSNNTDSVFLQNEIGNVDRFEYIVGDNSALNLNNTAFSSDKIRSSDGNNSVYIYNSGVLNVTQGKITNTTTFNTNNEPYSLQLPTNESLTVTTSQ